MKCDRRYDETIEVCTAVMLKKAFVMDSPSLNLFLRTSASARLLYGLSRQAIGYHEISRSHLEKMLVDTKYEETK